MTDNSDLEGTRALMGALVKQAPKHHVEMKIGKPEGKPIKKDPAKKRAAAAKPKTASRSASGS